MNDSQLTALAVVIVFPACGIIGAIAALMYSNSRITDAKETLRAEIGVLRADQKLVLERLEGKIDATRREMSANHQQVITTIEAHIRQLH